MKVAMLSDIHGNLEALKAVIKDAKSKGAKDYVILGDVVGYGPNPKECIKLVQKLNPSYMVMGNHDLCVSGVDMMMNPMAMAAIDWTKKNISSAHLNWLKNLPMTRRKNDCIFVHSCLHRPECFPYFMHEFMHYHMREQIKSGKMVCFIGHTHRPELVAWDEKNEEFIMPVPFFDAGVEAQIDINLYTVVNVGSVGQPRDRQWMATYTMVEMEDWKPISAQLQRVEYDVYKTVAKIYAEDIPKYCASRLIKYKSG